MKLNKDVIFGALNVSRSVKLVWQAGRLLTIATVLLMLLIGTLPLAGLWVTKLIVDKVTLLGNGAGQFAEVVPWIALAGALALCNVVVNALHGWVQTYQGQVISDRVITEIHAKAIQLDLSFFENTDFYDTLHRALAEGPYRPQNIIRHLTQLGQNSVSVVAIAGLLLHLHWILGVLLLVVSIPGAWVSFRYSKHMFNWQNQRTLTERQSDYFNWLLTRDIHAKEIRLFQLGPFFGRKSIEVRKILRKERLNLKGRQLLASSLAQALATSLIFICMGWIALQTVQGAISVGAMVMYAGAFQRGGAYLKSGLAALVGIYEDNLFLRHYHQVMTIEPKVASPQKPLALPPTLEEGISIRGMSFAYPNAAAKALSDIDMTLRPGLVTALVGPNGSGKTTLTKLICRLYDPDQGALLIDGVDLRDVDLEQWRARISVIFQDFARYHFQVANNIRVGDINLPENSDRIRQAANLSGAAEFIGRLPHQYETWLGNWFHHGVELSTGQWQKIALARAFIREAQILIMDEPTSSLDAESESALFKAFKKMLRGRTGLIVSHRFSTISMADMIYVLDQGCIVESGSHKALLGQDGLYSRMYRAQARHYTEG